MHLSPFAVLIQDSLYAFFPGYKYSTLAISKARTKHLFTASCPCGQYYKPLGTEGGRCKRKRGGIKSGENVRARHRSIEMRKERFSTTFREQVSHRSTGGQRELTFSPAIRPEANRPKDPHRETQKHKKREATAPMVNQLALP